MLLQSQVEIAARLAGEENPASGNRRSTGSRELSAASERVLYRLGRSAVLLFTRVALNMDVQWRARPPRPAELCVQAVS